MNKFYKYLFASLLLAFNYSCWSQSTQLQVETNNSFVNRENNYIGNTFIRSIKIFNVENGSFSGYIKIKDNSGSSLAVKMKLNSFLPASTPAASVALISVSPTSANANDVIQPIGNPVGLDLVAAQDNEIVVQVKNFKQNLHQLLITEDVSITACLDAGNSSNFSISFVSTTSDTPPQAGDYQLVQGALYSQIIYKGSKPLHKIFNYKPEYSNLRGETAQNQDTFDPTSGLPFIDQPSYYCTGNQNFKTLKFSLALTDQAKYSGATFHDFQLRFSNDGELFTIDRYSMVIEKRKTATNQLIQSYSLSDQYDVVLRPTDKDPTNENCLIADRKLNQVKYNIGDVQPDEFLYVQYDLYNCCKKADLFDGAFWQDDKMLDYSFRDDCGTLMDFGNDNQQLGPNTDYYGNKRGLEIRADVNSSPAYMSGASAQKSYPDLGNFIIDNPINTNFYTYNGVYGGFGFLYNPEQAQLVIRIKSGASLRYISNTTAGTVGTYDFPNNATLGNFSYYPQIEFINKNDATKKWMSVNPLGTVTATDPNGYETREFRFNLTEMPGLTASSSATDVFNAFYTNMANMQLAFSMEGLCSGSDDGTWEVQYLFDTDQTCSQCLLPVSKVGDQVVVTCPGCKVPGGVVRGSAERTVYGPYDVNNDGIPDQNENTINSLADIKLYNSQDSDPTNDVQTTMASAGDDITFAADIYLTAPSDCNQPGRVSCRDFELQYQWAYLQVKVPKGYFNPAMKNLQVTFKAATSSVYVPVTPHTVTYYSGPSLDVFYIKINVAATNKVFFESKDAFHVVFNSDIIFNPAQRERHEIQYMGYFTKAEEVITTLQVAHPDLYNRSYADCNTTEVRGISPNCDTETLQMICESWGSYLNFINIITRMNGAGYTGYNQAKSCIPYSKSNSTGFYGGEKSNFGNSADYYGINLYKNEFRKAPLLQYIHVVVPEGYYFNEIAIGTQSGAGQDVWSIKGATLDVVNKNKNSLINTGRVLDFDVRSLTSLANGVSNPAAPLHYSDESSTHDFFTISLLADCKYLADHGILKTDMGNVTIGSQKIYSTVEYDNKFVGNNGVFVIGGDNEYTKSPLFDPVPKPFVLLKKGAENTQFKIQKKTDFVNEFDLLQNYDPSTNYLNNYFGRMFIGVDPALIKTMFSDFKVEVSGVELIHINDALNLNTSFGFFESYVYPYAAVPIKVSGKVNITTIADCAEAKKALYSLIYGVHCNESQITAQSILGNTMCNKWTENIELLIDEVDLLLTTDVNSTYPIVSGSKVTHQAIFTATRSQVNQLDVQLSSTLSANTAIQSVAFIKNSGSASVSLPLLEGTNYTLSADKKTLSVFKFPDNTYFESINNEDDYYNEIEIIYDVQNTSCEPENIKTTITGTGTPFYSSTQCKTVRSKDVQSQLVADAPVVTISGPDHLCPGASANYNAVVTGVNPAGVTYTWYQTINSVKQIVQGPDNNAVYSAANLITSTQFSVTAAYGNCSATYTLDVQIYPLPVLTDNVPHDFCIGSAPYKLIGSPSGGVFAGTGVTLLSGVYVFNSTTPGSYDISYSYTDPVTGCHNTIHHTIEVSNCCKYALASTEVMCGEDAIKCITLKAVKPVDDGIKGMDFTLRYDRTLMNPTGIPGRGNATLGNVVLNGGMTSGMANYAMSDRVVAGTNFNELNVSIFYTGQAPAVADFDGIGDVICIEFKIKGSATAGLFGTTKSIFIGDIYGGTFSQGVVDDEHKVSMIRSCVENNGVGVISIVKNNFLNGRIYFHNDVNAPLRYDANTTPSPYLITTIKPITTSYGATFCTPSTKPTQSPDINGSFSVDMTGTNGLKVERDIVGDYYNSCTDPSDAIDQSGNVYKNNNPADVLLAINGYDAYLMESITTMRAPADVVYVADRKVPTVNNTNTANTLFPTPFQMIASDVNMDRKVRAADISLVQERAVSKLCEYPQVWNYNLGIDPSVYPMNTADQRSLDWRFIDKNQVNGNLVYQKSNKYPYPAGTTGINAAFYWRDNVPSPSFCMMGPIPNANACKSYPNGFDIHAIMLGDIDGSWRANLNNSQKNLRTVSDRQVVINLTQKQRKGLDTYRIPVTFTTQDPATVSLDFALDYNENELSILGVGNLEGGDLAKAELVYNDFENKQLLFTSYTTSGFNSSTSIYYIDVVCKNGELNPNMLGSGDAYLNGERVSLVVEGSTITGIEDQLSGSHYGFELVPNPAANQGEILYNIKAGSNARIVVYNTLGQTISEYDNLHDQGSIQISTSDWTSGMYQVILFTENSQKLIKKWVIQN